MRVDRGDLEVEKLINVRDRQGGPIVDKVPSYEHARTHGQSNLQAIRRRRARHPRTIALERVSAVSRRSVLPRIAYRLLAE